MDFKSLLKVNVQRVDQELELILAIYVNEVKGINTKLLPLALKFVDSCQGGKRIRGVLVKLGYEIARGTKNDDIFKVGAALEILHTSILIHDDIIDQSPKRRGKPTLYKSLGGNHYGISQAMILGDIGLYLQTKVISETSFSEENKLKALHHLSQVIIDTGWGEALDVELPRHQGGKEDDIELISILKTARYTFSGPLILGSILAGAEEGLLRALSDFGENLGIAFQIQDDILGIFGSEEALGKSVTSDIEEGKKTLLYNFALRKANSKQRRCLDKFYGQGQIGKRELEQIRQIFKDTGALEFAKNEAEKYKDKSLEVLIGKLKDERWSKLLEQLAEYMVRRSK